jgi:hypothetical protein
VTSVPTGTVIVAGTNLKPDISIAMGVGVGAGVGVGVGLGVGAGAWQDMLNIKNIVNSISPMIKTLVMLDLG